MKIEFWSLLLILTISIRLREEEQKKQLAQQLQGQQAKVQQGEVRRNNVMDHHRLKLEEDKRKEEQQEVQIEAEVSHNIEANIKLYLMVVQYLAKIFILIEYILYFVMHNNPNAKLSGIEVFHSLVVSSNKITQFILLNWAKAVTLAVTGVKINVKLSLQLDLGLDFD